MKYLFPAAILLGCLLLMTGGNAAWAVTYAYIPSFGNQSVIRIPTSDPDPASFATFDFSDDPELTCSPYGAAVAPSGSYVIVTCAGTAGTTGTDENRVAFLNNANFSETPTTPLIVPVGNEPRGVAVEPRGQFAYVSNYADESVSVINTTTRTVTTVDVGQGPFGIAAVREPESDAIKVYVANHLDGTVSVITNNSEILEPIDVGTSPVGVAAGPDGRHVYVAVSGSNLVRVIQTSDDTLVQDISVGRSPWGIAVGGQGRFVYVSNSETSFSADTIFNSVTVIRTTDFMVAGTRRVGIRPHGIAAPVNGEFAYVINQTDGTISDIDMATETPVVATLTMPEPNPLAEVFAIGAFIGGTPPAAPSSLSATADRTNRVDLTWTDNSDDELGFLIERRKQDETIFTEIFQTAADATSFSDAGASGESTYEYRIRAFNEAAFSDYAVSGEVTTPEDKFHWCFIGTLTRGLFK
jgi:YVTN family beta-propeller protein